MLVLQRADPQPVVGSDLREVHAAHQRSERAEQLGVPRRELQPRGTGFGIRTLLSYLESF